MPRHDGHQTTHERLAAVLLRAVAVLRRADIEHALIGGLASATMGRTRHTHDIDLFVAPDDAERALDALARAGFRTERTDPTWLYKAFWDGMLVDVIFVSKGGVVFEAAMCDVPTQPETEAQHHLAARVRQALATDPRVNEPHVSVVVSADDVV